MEKEIPVLEKFFLSTSRIKRNVGCRNPTKKSKNLGQCWVSEQNLRTFGLENVLARANVFGICLSKIKTKKFALSWNTPWTNTDWRQTKKLASWLTWQFYSCENWWLSYLHTFESRIYHLTLVRREMGGRGYNHYLIP